MDWSVDAEHILGLAPAAMPASWREARKLIHPEDLPQAEQQVEAALATRTPLRLELRMVAGEGVTRVLSVDSEIELDASGGPIGMTCTVLDVTDRLHAEQRIHALRYYDRVTELPNVLFLREHLEHLLPLASRRRYRVGVLAVGFAGIARLLAPLGRAGMDGLMRALGQRLATSVRDADMVTAALAAGAGDETTSAHVARADNDTFCVVLSAIEEPAAAGAAAARLAAALREPLTIGGMELSIEARIGVAVYPDDATEVDRLLDHADNALAQAIERSDEPVAFFSSAFHAASRRRLSLESALRKTVERGELELHFQPKLWLTSRQPSGCEALLRWRHPDDGLVSPDQFVPLAEELGLIVPIGEWAVAAAVAELAAWRQLGLSDLGVAINVSPRQLQDDCFAAAVDTALRRYGVPGAAVEIEIVESLLVADRERAHAFIGAMHELGVRVALDDFGTGYSSLSYLRQFPIDVLKLDRSFLLGIPDEAAANAVVSGIIALARALDLEVVAEGVEVQPQLDFLAAQRCDQAQGYLIARPQPAAAVRPWLEAALGNPRRRVLGAS
jgi:EAL domain-containing protein (putative c-di-GMP-specific phosphodiesterase class I)/GGDEF domain-containing protein